MENEVLLFPVHDPDFKCDSVEQYAILMNWLAKTTLQLREDYPDHPILVTYVVAENGA